MINDISKTRSPQMLMVSGIGPSSILNQHGIQVLKDSPVGQNWQASGIYSSSRFHFPNKSLQDHCAFEFTYPMNVEGNAALDGNTTFLDQATQEFLNSQTGPLTNWGGDILGKLPQDSPIRTANSTSAFEKLPKPYRSALNGSALKDLSTLADDQPEIEWLTASHGPQKANSSYVTFTPAIAGPMSKGTISLKSADTADNPIVDPKTFTHPTDRALGVQIFKRLQDVVKASGLTTGPEMKVGLSPNATNAQILNGIQQTGLPWYHGVASCKIVVLCLHESAGLLMLMILSGPMGNETDPAAVVDSHGRVYGVKGVRVVDASIIPFAVPGHSMSHVCKWLICHAQSMSWLT